jgi:A/G-specific adenine glycosylase
MSRLSTRLLAWYDNNKRDLPWRAANDPYAIWVSEIMLQQTRVETVIPYYIRWLALFPTVHALAGASERMILNAWEGLGYYSRARNLHKAAKIVVDEYGGKLPRDLGKLGKLPGIGRYTVGALASIIFGMDEPALDGNLKRVYARLFDVSTPVDSSEGESLLSKFARENLPGGKAADFNQALMDLGALICLPKNPRCSICPLTKFCKSRENGTQNIRPVKKPKRAVPHYVHAAAVIVRRIGRGASPKGDNPPRDEVLLAKRPSEGLLGGLWEFPNARVDRDPARGLAKAIRSAYNLRLRVKRKVRPIAIVEHTYSHFKVTTHAIPCEISTIIIPGNLKWIPLKKLDDFPMGRIDRQIAEKIR